MDVKQKAQDFVDNLSPEIIEEFKKAFSSLIAEQETILTNLTNKKSELEQERKILYEKEKSEGYSSQNQERRMAISQQVKTTNLLIQSQQNVILAIKNGGDLISFTDKKDVRHENIPSFTKVDTQVISFNEDTILVDQRPPYIPVINEEIFRIKGYVFDAIRVAPDQYILATHGYKDKIIGETVNKFAFTGSSFEKESETTPSIPVPDAELGYCMVTLDQLVLISDYYYTKAKATNKLASEEKNKRQEEWYDKLPLTRREYVLNQKGFYHSLPVAVKKKITQSDYEALSTEEKEALYKPFARSGVKRLTSKLDDQHMWVSFHNMYERFLDPTAVQPSRGHANHVVFLYWAEFRDMMRWKINDIRVQREIDNENYKTAVETSFGESNTNDALFAEWGILVKRQNGDAINAMEIDTIQKAWGLVNGTFGDVIGFARKVGLKISHTGKKLVFSSKAVGMYIPKMKTVSVSEKYGEQQFGNIMAHETAHFIDHMLGSEEGKRYFTDNYESLAGKIAFQQRKSMNVPTESDYLNATKECFARALEQYYAISVHGEGAELIASSETSRIRTYFNEDAYLNKEKFEALRPMIVEFLEKELTKYIPRENGISKSVSQGNNRTEDEINIRNEEIASELRRRIRTAQEDGGSGSHGSDTRGIDNKIAYDYAKETGTWINDINDLGDKFESGNENVNVFNSTEQKIYKSNNLMNTISLSSFFEKIKLHNLYFPETAYTFEGFTGLKDTGTGKPYTEPVYSQDFIKNAEYATPEEISDYMIKLGFEQLTSSRFKKDDIEVWDLLPRNVLKDKNGDIYVIDAEFKLKKTMENKFTFLSNSPMQQARAITVLSKKIRYNDVVMPIYEMIEDFPAGLEVGVSKINSSKSEKGYTEKLTVGNHIMRYKAEQDYYNYLQNGGYKLSQHLQDEKIKKAKLDEEQRIEREKRNKEDEAQRAINQESADQAKKNEIKMFIEQGKEGRLAKFLSFYENKIKSLKQKRQTKDVIDDIAFNERMIEQTKRQVDNSYKIATELYELKTGAAVRKYDWKVGDSVLYDGRIETVIEATNTGMTGDVFKVEKREGIHNQYIGYDGLYPVKKEEKMGNISDEKETIKDNLDKARYDMRHAKTAKELNDANFLHDLYTKQMNDFAIKTGVVKESSELTKGTKVEQEHADTLKKVATGEISPKQAVVEVAKEHIAEDPKYYSKMEEPTVLHISSEAPLSSQMVKLTGDPWSTQDFESVDGGQLTTERPFRHIKTGKVFLVAPKDNSGKPELDADDTIKDYSNLIPLQRESVSLLSVFKGLNGQHVLKFEWKNKFYEVKYIGSSNEISKSNDIKVTIYDSKDSLMKPLSISGDHETIIYNTFNSDQQKPEGKYIVESLAEWNMKEFFSPDEPVKVAPLEENIFEAMNTLREKIKVQLVAYDADKKNRFAKDEIGRLLSTYFSEIVEKYPEHLYAFIKDQDGIPLSIAPLAQWTIQQDTSEEFRKNLKNNIWAIIPEEYKEHKLPKRLNYSPTTTNENLLKIIKPFLGDDGLRVHLSGAHFDKEGVVATNAQILIFLSHPEEARETQTFCMTKKCFEINENKAEIEARYPAYKQVIPDNHTFVSIHSESLYNYLKTVIDVKYHSISMNEVFIKFSEDTTIAFNAYFLLPAVKAMIELGYDQIDISYSTANRAVVLCKKGEVKNVHKLQTDFVLVMPIMKDLPFGTMFFNAESECAQTQGIEDKSCLNPIAIQHKKLDDKIKHIEKIHDKIVEKEKVEQDYQALAEELMSINSNAVEKLGIASGSHLYHDIDLQKKYKSSIEQATKNLVFPLSMKVHDILEDENQHFLNQHLYLSGAFGEKQRISWLDFLNKLKPEYKLNYLDESVYEPEIIPKLAESETDDTQEAIDMLTELLQDAKGKEKKEISEAIEMLKEMLPEKEEENEIHYISYLNKDNNFKQTDKEFKGKNSYQDAVKWGKENLPNFNIDMVRMKF